MTENSINAALAKAQAEMGKAIRSVSNPHLKSKYADLASVMAACVPALNAHGIAVIQPTVDDGDRWFVETIFLHEGGEQLSCRVPLIVAKNDMQGYGSAVTYARRYGLMCMAGVAPEDDDGAAAVKNAPPPRQQSTPAPTGPTNAAIQKAIAFLGVSENLDALKDDWIALGKELQAVPAVLNAKNARKQALMGSTDEVPGDLAADLNDALPY